MNQTFKRSKRLSIKEEVGNSVSHGIGAFAMLILLPISVTYTYTHHNLRMTIGISIFLISLFAMFLSSAIYHAMPYGSTHKYVLRIIDHSMIYIAIAGSYTPVALSLLPGAFGYSLMIFQWTITIFGILYKIFAKRVNEKFSLALYLAMGWLVIFLLPMLMKKTTTLFWLFMVGGGVSYSLGAVFYSRKGSYDHLIWHLFILMASILHYLGIVYFMV